MAVVEHDGIEITPRISEQAGRCYEFNGMYTRESLDAYNRSKCGYRDNKSTAT